MDVSFKNLINDYYVKDLSNKMKTAHKTRMLSGKFISSNPIFGYDIAKEKERKIVIDEYSSEIVRRIFNMIVEGYRTTEIARILNSEKIPTPSKYRKQKNKYKKTNDNFWRNNIVYKIATDKRYTGKGVYGKTEKLEIAKNKVRILPKNHWIEIENNHPAIISEEVFEKALHKLKYYYNPEDNMKKQRVLYDKVKCHCCNYTMLRTKARKSKYICETPKFIESPCCVTTPVSEIELENVILKAIQTKLKLVVEQQEIKKVLKQKFKQNKIDVVNQIKKLQTSIKKLNELKFKTYEKYKDGQITKEDFQKQKLQLDSQLEKLEVEVKECELAKDEDDKENISTKTPFLRFIENGEPLTELTRELVDTLVEKIIIYDVDKFEIVWNFNDIFI